MYEFLDQTKNEVLNILLLLVANLCNVINVPKFILENVTYFLLENPIYLSIYVNVCFISVHIYLFQTLYNSSIYIKFSLFLSISHSLSIYLSIYLQTMKLNYSKFGVL